jgi:aromatic ring-cleaving dioxygenase
MSEQPTSAITGYHAHVYYDAATKPAAESVRAGVEARFEARLGRWHDQPIGPHPMGSFQIAFAPEMFAEIVPWLALNRRGLTVFIHPETGDDVSDHSDHAIWLGAQREVDLSVL